jgi:hypothetical protein
MIKKLAAEWIGIIYQKVVGQRHDFELTLTLHCETESQKRNRLQGTMCLTDVTASAFIPGHFVLPSPTESVAHLRGHCESEIVFRRLWIWLKILRWETNMSETAPFKGV